MMGTRVNWCWVFGHKWGPWRLSAGLLFMLRECQRGDSLQMHSVWECANEGHDHK